jgi:hypothetical protein
MGDGRARAVIRSDRKESRLGHCSLCHHLGVSTNGTIPTAGR